MTSHPRKFMWLDDQRRVLGGAETENKSLKHIWLRRMGNRITPVESSWCHLRLRCANPRPQSCIKVDHLNWPRRSVHGPQLVGTMEELQQPRVTCPAPCQASCPATCPATCHVSSLLPTNRNILPERLNDKDLQLLLGLYGLCYYAKQSH